MKTAASDNGRVRENLWSHTYRERERGSFHAAWHSFSLWCSPWSASFPRTRPVKTLLSFTSCWLIKPEQPSQVWPLESWACRRAPRTWADLKRWASVGVTVTHDPTVRLDSVVAHNEHESASGSGRLLHRIRDEPINLRRWKLDILQNTNRSRVPSRRKYPWLRAEEWTFPYGCPPPSASRRSPCK